jgi:ribosomal 30S subunit maturation factor RimM
MFDRDRWDSASHLVGESVVDKDNRKIGRVDAIAEAMDGMEPEWLVVRTSLFGRPRLIPIDIVRELDDEIHIPFSKRTVLLAPVPEILTNVDRAERQALDFHYKRAA